MNIVNSKNRHNDNCQNISLLLYGLTLNKGLELAFGTGNILNLIVFSLANDKMPRKSYYYIIFNFLVFMNTLAWFYYDFIIYDRVKEIIVPLFEYNILRG